MEETEKTYTTIHGDTWDAIAYKIFGNEYYCTQLMDLNREYLEYMIFPSGIVLKLPSKVNLGISSTSKAYPDWRAQLNG